MKNQYTELFFKALSEKNNKNYLKSKKIFNKLLSTEKVLEAKFHLSQIYLLEKEFSYAKPYIEEMILKEYELPANLNNYSTILCYEKKYGEAIVCLKKALKFRPNDVYVEKSIAYIYRLNKQYAEAEKIYKKILTNHPLDVLNLIHISNLYFILGKTFLGLKFLLKAYQLDKANYETIFNLIARLPYVKIKYQKYLELLQKIIPKKILHENKIQKKSAINHAHKTTNLEQKKNLKLGFVSTNFFSHPVGYFLLDFLKTLKTYDVQIYLISDRNSEDNYTKEIKQHCHAWIKIFSMNNFTAMEKILSFELDFLFDLNGITNANRRDLFSCKLANKMVSWLGWFTSTGIPNIDYIHGDRHATPDNDQCKFSEKLVNNNNIWSCLSTSDILDVNSEINLDKKYFVYGMFQNPLKMSRQLIKAWSEILNKSKNTEILFGNNLYDNKLITKRILKLFSYYNVNLDKIKFSKKKDRRQAIERYNLIDAVLDTFPFNGATSSFEASFMGVPIITLNDTAHPTFRAGVSINSNLNLEKYIANNEKDYVFKALQLADNKSFSLRKNLMDSNRKSRLFDMKNFVEKFYETYNRLS